MKSSVVYLACLVLTLLFQPLFGVERYVSSSADLRRALTEAGPGDQIVVADGTYTGRFDISTRPGVAANPIVLRAKNRHRAVLLGSGSDSDSNNIGIQIAQSWWVIDGFEMKYHREAIICDSGTAVNLEIKNNIIQNFTRDGIRIRSSHNYIHHNVIAFSRQPSSADAYGGIRLLKGASDNIIEGNIVYGIGNNAHTMDNPWGMGIYAAFNVHRNTFRGNLVMDCARAGIRVYSDNDPSRSATGNVIRDNVVAFAHGGAISVNSYYTNDSLVSNNVLYGNYFEAWSAKGNVPGRNTFTHNTIYLTEFSMRGATLFNSDTNVPSKDSVVRDNLFYANFGNSQGQWLWSVLDWAGSIAQSDHNLFWRPGSESTWVKNVGFASSDIHSASLRPSFVDETRGDLSLAAGSPGKRAASDGSDIGSIFNAFLRKDWLIKVLALPQQVKPSNGGTSVSFPTSTGYRYQVYAYVPDDYHRGAVTYTIGGESVTRDLLAACTKSSWGSTWIEAAPRRWLYLGTHTADSSLNVSWSTAKGADKIFIRQMPQAREAFTWLGLQSQTVVPSAPRNLTVTGVN